MEYVGIVLEGEDDSIYLQFRGNKSGQPANCVFPGFYGLWGGAVEEGETPRIASMRELYEELRIIVNESDLEFLMKAEINENNHYIFTMPFQYDPKIHQDHEGLGIRKFDKKESLEEEMIVPEVKKRLPGYWMAREMRKKKQVVG